ncbi:MAG TPA: STAS domain-containing protein [Candidatus Baltobacteraceae bacterium]|nr:STAS domain-containing protein [Candidatus Baltobacteraceae bacterium]
MQRTAYVALSGEFDIHNCKNLEQLLPPPDGSTRVIVDCTHVRYMDTAALGALIQYRRACSEYTEEPDIVIVAPQGPLRKVFDIVGFVKLFQVVDSVPAE